MKVIFLAYRKWALDVYDTIKKHPKVHECKLARSKQELDKIDLSAHDLLITCGWSDEIGKDIAEKIPSIGVHCAELDRYSYGTPIQLQIIDGLTVTKHRIFSFTYDENSKRAHTHNRMYSHEVALDLSGNMEDILYQMTATSKVLFNMYLTDYPNITWQEWPEENVIRNKRTPSDSRLTKDQITNMDTEQLYNFFRCLEEPYPNGYIEDDKGRLYIQKVLYRRKDN